MILHPDIERLLREIECPPIDYGYIYLPPREPIPSPLTWEQAQYTLWDEDKKKSQFVREALEK